MTSSVRTPVMQYAVAMVIVGAAAVLTRLTWGVTGSASTSLFLVAVAISAWLGGMGPGLMASGASLGAIAGLVFLLGDVRELTTKDVLQILSLLPVALVVGLLYSKKARAERALRERDARLQLVSEQIPGGLWSTDTELRVTSGFGAKAGVLHGAPGSSLFEHFNTSDGSFEPIAAHRRALRGESSGYEVDWSGRTFQCHVEPLRDIEGRIIGVIGVGTDITERKQADEKRERAEAEIRQAKQQLESANQQLESASRAKDRFLAVLSHELRTPLTPVLALASALAEHSTLPPELREDLDTIRRNVELEATLIDDLLDITRIARGKLQLHLKDIDAHDLLTNAVEICLADASGRGVEVTTDLSAPEHFVRCDGARLQQVFWNVIKNAIKFTPAGGRVYVCTQTLEDGRLRVEVRDTGIGIDAEMLPRIFDAFEQGAPSITRQFGGLGLGLAISKALVDAHHGRIVVESDGLGRGACFGVELATVHAVPVETSAGGRPEGVQVAGGLKILLVEDHVDTARVMQKLLRSSGHRVETAASVAGALGVLDTQEMDLLISDVGLPDGSGLDLMRDAVRRHHLKGIALSGFGTEEDVARSHEAGFAAHLTKPVAISTLREVIAEVTAGESRAAVLNGDAPR